MSDNEDVYGMEEKYDKRFSFGRLIKIFIYCIAITVVACIVIRSIGFKSPSLAEKVIYNSKTVEAYQGKETVCRQYGMEDFWRSINENHLLMLDNLYYLPESRQLQVLVKYRTSYAEPPTADNIPFEIYLVDEVANKYTDCFFETAVKGQYGYIRICFEGIDLENPVSGEKKLYNLYVELKKDGGETEKLADFPIYNGSDLYMEKEFSFE